MKDQKSKSLEKRPATEIEATREGATFLPPTDIYEQDTTILVRCDMPGVGQEQLEITLENNELVISGRQADAAPDGFEPLTTEYETGTYRRTFKIPQLIDRENIVARLHNGVLDLELPKAEQAKPHRIEITTGG